MTLILSEIKALLVSLETSLSLFCLDKGAGAVVVKDNFLTRYEGVATKANSLKDDLQ